MLEEDDAVGQALPLVCANHPEYVSGIKTAADFDIYARDGGCSQQCNARMPCGHTCPRSPRHLLTPNLALLTQHTECPWAACC